MSVRAGAAPLGVVSDAHPIFALRPVLRLPDPTSRTRIDLTGSGPGPCAAGPDGCPCGTDHSWDRAVAGGSNAQVAPVDDIERALLRWMLGHHAAFLTWRLAAAALVRLARPGHDQHPDQDDLDAVARAFDAYSVLLLYSGSISRALYESVVRPAMAAAHPAFSGRWAREAEPLPGLLTTARERHGRRRIANVLTAQRVNRHVHLLVARRLVPEGGSLLTHSGREPQAPVTRDEQDTFDRFFLVERGPTCADLLDRQLGTVLGRVAADLVAHPLTLVPQDVEHFPAPLLPALHRLVAHAAAEICDLAATAGGTP